MATIVQTEPPPPATLALPIYRFSVEQYHQMAAAEILTEEDRVELLDGWIARKMTRKPPHDTVIDIVHEALRDLLPKEWRIRIQSAVTTGDSEPEPDLAVVRGPGKRYLNHHPTSDDIAMIVEVADTSLERDRWKAGIYARAGIPAYWIVNLVDNQVEVYTDPSGPSDEPGYAKRADVKPADSVSVVIEGRQFGTIDGKSLLP
ncbi:MAG: Uma2 family endonuclease [Planctomycetaceae bacterium]